MTKLGQVDSCLASPHPFREKQPDGSMTPLLWIHGGPQFHYMSDTRGYTVMGDEKNQLVYAMRDPSSTCMVPSGMMVGRDDPQAAGIEKGIFPDANQQAEMCGRMCEYYDDDGMRRRSLSTLKPISRSVGITNRKNLVILLRFSNHHNRQLPSVRDIDTLFNKEGGHQVVAPSGSIRDVYAQSSYGKFSLESTVYGWVDVKKVRM